MNPPPRSQPFGRGMQIHAVPDHERYTDSLTNTQLPWGYSTSHTSQPDLLRSERHPSEKESGPFGRSVRRRGTSRSRSKTAEPRKEEDRLRAETQRVEDEVFLGMRGGAGERDEGGKPAEAKGSQAVVVQAAAPSEPTEVLLYGFSPASQYAALDFYETVSGGVVLEDYERHSPTARPDLMRTKYRLAAQRSLSKASLQRKNRFAGGEHWVKITFDSLGAATLAVEKSPHIVKGCLVYAEFWRGAGPQRDEVIWASQAGAQITDDALPMTFSTTTGTAVAVEGAEGTEDTMSSGTVADAGVEEDGTPRGIGRWPSTPDAGRLLSAATRSTALQSSASSMALQSSASTMALQTPAAPRLTRIPGATPAKLLPADMALMPKQPKQSWIAWLSGSEIIGATVPRTAEGKFDWDRAGAYWRVAYWLDSVMGWDLCGLKGE